MLLQKSGFKNREGVTAWSEQEYQTVIEFYGKKTMRQIGEMLGRNRNMVASAIRTLKDKGAIKTDVCPQKGRRKDYLIKWTHEEEMFLVNFYGQKSLDEIAKELGKTKKAVSGKATNLRKDGSLPPLSKAPKVPKPQPPVAAVKKTVFTPITEAIIEGLTIIELTHETCRYPITENTPHLFCGKKIEHGVYCKEHGKMCYRPNVKKKVTH